jgi:preprotein translocase subunit SecE
MTLIAPFLTRRTCMLDLLIVVVTIVMFVAFIGFTDGCERL